MYAYLRAACPIAPDLRGQVISSESCDEDWDDLRLSVFDDLAHARLSWQIAIRVAAFIARAFRVKAYDVAFTVFTQLQKPARGICVKVLFSGVIEKGWVHRPEAHYQIYKHSQPALVEESAAYRKEEAFLPFGVFIEHSRDYIHIKERAMISYEQDWPFMVEHL